MPGTDEMVYVGLECCFENEVERVEFSVTSSARLYRLTRRFRTLSRTLSLAGGPHYGAAGDTISRVVVVSQRRR